MAWNLLSSHSTSTITKMSVYTCTEGRHGLARPHRAASTNYPCKTPGSVLLDSSHRLETNLASRWEGVRLLRVSGKAPDFPGSSPTFPGSFSATSPEVVSLWNLTAIQRFPGSVPNLPGSSPKLPWKFPDSPGGQPLSLGSLTPWPDSQKLSLNRARKVRGMPQTQKGITSE